MKINELRARENYDRHLIDTLKSISELDADVFGDTLNASPFQWYLHPFFSVYTAKNFCAEGRQYLRLINRHSPSLARRIVQGVSVDIMAAPYLYQVPLKTAFQQPIACNPDSIMWMPGNHRFRRFDFSSKRIRIYPKAGFSIHGIVQEMQRRQQLSPHHSWILPILSGDAERGTFEESLIHAIPINREPNRAHRRLGMVQANAALNSLHHHGHRRISGREYADILSEKYQNSCRLLHKSFPGVSTACVDTIIKEALNTIRKADRIDISLTHGDFQPGNILIAEDEQIYIIDWEDAGIRASVYDAMTYILQSRTQYGVMKRLADYQKSPRSYPLDTACDAALASALWLAEDWIWLFESSSRPGINRLPLGLCLRFREIAQ